jgi:hypothetical protein
MLHLPDKPGLGIELNSETVRRLALPPDGLIPDGNYFDLVFGQEHWSVPHPYTTGIREEALEVEHK